MTNRIITLIFAVAIAVATFAAQKDDPNIVISSWDETYELIPDGKNNLKSIKRTLNTRYKAVRKPGTAVAYVDYDDNIKVEKASGKGGGKPVYASATDKGILYDDSKICLVEVELTKAGQEGDAKFVTTNSRPETGFISGLLKNYPIESYVYRIVMPAEMKERFDIMSSNLPESASISREATDGGKKWTITLSASSLPALAGEGSAPAGRYHLPFVWLSGMYPDVQAYYRHLHSFIAPDPDPESVAAKATEITVGCSTDLERIAAITHWVRRNIRYVAIEHGHYGVAPDAASQVLSKRYGDCKGSAILIRDMLRASGIDGRFVWIGTSSIPQSFTEMPTYGAGNHAIAAAVMADGSILYLDGTVGISDIGYYQTGIQGRQTLVENGDECIIGRVPEIAPEDNSEIMISNFSIDGSNLTGSFEKSLRGQMKSGLLNSLNSNASHSYQKILQSCVSNGYSNYSPIDISLEDGEADNGPTRLTGSLAISNAVSNAGGKIYLSLNPSPDWGKMTVDNSDRKYPVQIYGPSMTRRVMTVAIPEGHTVTSVPENVTIDSPWLNTSVVYAVTDNEVSVTLDLKAFNCIVSLKEIERYNADIKKIQSALTSKIVISKI
ncbi:MAG: transglutaminase-like domain-containing protein [Lachnoclostridium sp.]|nr:transglutaminase-like domain-containing protein [Lachnoclostridium sp.]